MCGGRGIRSLWLLLLAVWPAGCGSDSTSAETRPSKEPAAPALSADAAVHPYLCSPGRTGMTVAWLSAVPATFRLRYGEGERLTRELAVNPVVPAIKYTAEPETQAGSKSAAPSAEMKCYQYLARLTDLKPGTRYLYEVSGLGGTIRGSFRTFPEAAEKFSFIACADTQNVGLLPSTAASFAKLNPAFIVHAGDMVDTGSVFPEWERSFFSPLEQVVDHIPLLPALGNHDGGKFAAKLFAFPEGRGYYSYDYSNAHFVVLKSAPHARADAEMLRWCEADLAASRADWKIVYYHHPSYDAGANEADCWGRSDVVPVLRKTGVDVVFGGHTHAYQRFLPMYTPGENEAHPIEFVVLGTAAGGGMWVDRDPALAFGRSASTFLLITVDGKKLSARAMAPDGTEVDSFEIRKDAAGKLAPEWLGKAVPESLFGELRHRMQARLDTIALPASIRSGRPVGVRFALPAGNASLKYELALAEGYSRRYDIKVVSGEVPAGGTVNVETEIRLREPERYAAKGAGNALPRLPELRLALSVESAGQKAVAVSDDLAREVPEYEAMEEKGRAEGK